MQRPDCETQVKIDYRQLAVRQPDSGDGQTDPSAQDVARHHGPEETAPSKTDLNKQIDEKLRANGRRSLNAVTGRQLSCKSCETRCPMERPSSKRTEMMILRVRLETAGETTILYKLTLGEVDTTIRAIGFMMSERHAH